MHQAMDQAADDPVEQGSLLLQDQLGFALYAASRAVTARYRPLLDELGLTCPQYLVMLALWDRDRISVRDVGTALQLESSTLSPLLKRLEAAGLIRRERRADDERSVALHLTPAGAELRDKARTVPVAIGEAMGLSSEQQATCEVSRSGLQDRLNRLGGIGHANLLGLGWYTGPCGDMTRIMCRSSGVR